MKTIHMRGTVHHSPYAVIGKRLQDIAVELRQGQSFMSTRLTLLKRPCADVAVAGAFALYIARKVEERAAQVAPRYVKETRWQQYLPLMRDVVDALQQASSMHFPETRAALFTAVHKLADMQSHVTPIGWNSVREIEYADALIVETAGQCMLDSSNSSYWAYQLARSYAERFDTHYGTGLIPESAPLVNDIAAFWFDLDAQAAV